MMATFLCDACYAFAFQFCWQRVAELILDKFIHMRARTFMF